MNADPWGTSLPPVELPERHVPLPPRLAELAALTGRRELEPAESFDWPDAAELPEVRALSAHGWRPLDEAWPRPILPAVWPAEHRCWVPDRLPRISQCFDGRGQWLQPWNEDDQDNALADAAELASEAGLPAPPAGRLWLLRSPWSSLGLTVSLSLVMRRGEELSPDQARGDLTRLVDAARDLLSWSEDQLWSWWSGPSAEAARAWKERGRVGEDVADLVLQGLGPAEIAALTAMDRPGDPGLTEKQAVAWCEAVAQTGSAAVERILAWRGLGLPPDPPKGAEWILTEGSPQEVARWFDAGFSLSDQDMLLTLPLDDAIAWRDAGLAASETRCLLRADPMLTPDEAVAFDALGVAASDRPRWVEAGFDAAAARRWTDLGVLPNEARVWRSVGKGPEDARAQLEAGGGSFPTGVSVGWAGFGFDPASRRYGVVDPPGTRGSIAAEDRETRW